MKQKTQNDRHYKKLVASLRHLEFEGVVKTKHAMGKRILQYKLKYNRAQYGGRLIENLAKDLDTSTRDLWCCVQFAKKCDNITQFAGRTWYWITHKYLPESTKADPADDKIPDNVKRRCKPGDLWVLGRHRLLCGDATRIEDVKLLLYGLRADIAITSPPYNLGNKKRYLHDTDSRSPSDYLKLLIDSTALALIPCQYVFINLGLFAANKQAIIEYQYEGRDLLVKTLIWDKITPVPSKLDNVFDSQFEYVFCFSEKGNSKIGTAPFTGLSDIIRISNRQDKNKILRATFSVSFALVFVVTFARPNKIVYDPFGGTGTTLIACEKSEPKRSCYMLEIDADYCNIILQRWEDHTKRKAALCQWQHNNDN